MKKSVALLLTVILVATVATVAVGQTLEELLSQVGEDYAEGYTSPFLYAFGPNQTANLYQTAHISWGGLTWGVGLKAMGTYLNEADQSFRKVISDVDLHLYFPDDFPEGTIGDIVMGGPTMFGDTKTDGTLKGYYNGVEVGSYDTISGLIDTRWVPMATPEGYIGGFVGLRAVIRWLPSFDIDEYGTFEYLGLGLQWNVSGLFENMPVDILVGYFKTDLKVGTIFDSTAESLHLGVSKSFPALTVYGGYAKESSTMDVTYVFEDPVNNINEPIGFSIEGRQDHRWTLGVTLDILLKLNFEMGHGDLTTYSAGLMFGM